MHPTSHSRPRRRRLALVIAGVAIATALSPLVGPSPAGAATAPLVTTDGVGIRVDENALNGPALTAIENALQPFVNDMIRDGATGPGAPFGGHVGLNISSDVNLSLDFLVPGGSRPYGGLKVHADIEDIEIRYKMDPVWPFSDCYIWVRPDTGTVDAVGKVDPTELPDAPLVVEPITATWDDDPSVTSDGVCWTYVVWQAITNWWDGIWNSSNPTSTAARIEAELNDVAQDLIDDLWEQHVVPVVESLESFGLSWGQLRTDDHGLIVTANVDASGGITIPGFEFFSFNVANTEDAGVTSNVNDLLAARSQITVTIHPNVVNQYLNAINQLGGFTLGTIPIGPSVESFLLPEDQRHLYSDSGWTLQAAVNTPYYAKPTGPGGAPQVELPQMTYTFRNSSSGSTRVATFQGSMTGIDLITEVRSGADTWGPGLDPDGAAMDVTINPALTLDEVEGYVSNPNGILPFAQEAVNSFNDFFLVQFVSLAPIEIGDLSVVLCTTCPRVSGDQRYTEFFNVTT